MPSIGGIVCHTYVYEKHMPCLKMKNIRLGNKLFFLIKKSSDKKKFPPKKIHRGQFSGGNFPVNGGGVFFLGAIFLEPKYLYKFQLSKMCFSVVYVFVLNVQTILVNEGKNVFSSSFIY